MSQTRRLAAILAADVAGYSRVIGADEGGPLEVSIERRQNRTDGRYAPLGSLYRPMVISVVGCTIRSPCARHH